MMEIKRLLIDSIRKSKAKYFGHMVIQNGLPRLLLEGKIHGKGGKRSQELHGQLKERTGKTWRIRESCGEQTRMEVLNSQSAGSR